MAWIVTLISGVSKENDYWVGVIEDRAVAEEVAPLMLEIYNREFPEYSHYVLGEVVDGPVRFDS
jgi:hypothetical protein